ncbi:MAG: glycerophosphodiester phosphodiesterase [Clostridia bacterium]|nr:glycerophosphodiester phosphodiesterase [Clostridia bacterium]
MELDFILKKPIAHRGLHDENNPENSVSAFQAAIECGFPIETDVRLSKDGKIVVFHDDSLERMTGANLLVKDCSFEDLSVLHLANSQERIPLFSEFLREIDGKVPLLIELKNMPSVNRKDFLRLFTEELKDYKGEYAVQSFQPFYIGDFKKLRPDIPAGILATADSSKKDFNNSPIWKIKARAVKNMSFNKRVKPDFISYHFTDYPNKATEKFTGHKLGWTVRSPEEEVVARKYADNIIFEGYMPKIPE